MSLYAELLLNIRQVNAIANLPSPCNEGTRVELASDSQTLHLYHDDVHASIKLPCPVISNSKFKVSSLESRELSLRLQPKEAIKLASGRDAPWPAPTLTADTEIACRSCKHLFVKSVQTWKDLPNGGWADMMDFWHCHKPDADNDVDTSAGSTKGYSAANTLSPMKGIGLVDIGHFLLLDSDCVGMEKRVGGGGLLQCASCLKPVGLEDSKTGGFQLFKWSLALKSPRIAASPSNDAPQSMDEADWETTSIQKIISSRLLLMIEDQAVHRFLLYSGTIQSAKEALLLWVFTPDLLYSSTESPAKRAMKVFYSDVANPLQTLENGGSRIEELQLPQYALTQFYIDLKSSTQTLPHSAQKHQQWTIGLLDR